MTSLDFTESQRDREIQLLLTEIGFLVEEAVGDANAAFAALRIPDDSEFRTNRHPDHLPELDRFAITRHVATIERYVRNQAWDSRIAMDIKALDVIAERVFSPSVVESYEEEHAEHPPLKPKPDVDSDNGNGQSRGLYYLGILHSLLGHAKARLKVDKGEPLTLGEIALLTNSREATVMTAAHRANFDTHEEGSRRLANPSEPSVLEWMKGRGYQPTRREPETEGAHAAKANRGEAPVPEYFTVPVASDGSWFSPRCATAGGYTIGAKGDEMRHQDYFEALAALMKMKSPKWRRPNTSGNRGIVTATRYERVTRAEIEQVLNDHPK